MDLLLGKFVQGIHKFSVTHAATILLFATIQLILIKSVAVLFSCFFCFQFGLFEAKEILNKAMSIWTWNGDKNN